MPSVPAPADPGRDGDPAWLDRDPMTAAEREAWLDRLCAQDDDPFDDPQEYWDPEPGSAGRRPMRGSRWMRRVRGGGVRGRPGRRGPSRVSRRAGRPGSAPGWRGM